MKYNPARTRVACFNELTNLVKHFLTIMLLIGVSVVVRVTFAEAVEPTESTQSVTTKEVQAGDIICAIYQVDANNQMKIVQKGEDCEGLLWLMDENGKSA